MWEIYVRENSGQEDNLSKSHAFSWISHKSEHFDFPHFFSSVSSGHDRSRLAPSSYDYTTQLVFTCVRVSGCTLPNIQDQRANLKPIKTNRIKEAVLFSGVSWRMSEYNPLAFLLRLRGSSASVTISDPSSSGTLSLSNLVARLFSSHMLPWLNPFTDYLIKKWFWVKLDWFTFGKGQMINDGSWLLGPPGFRVHVLQQTRHRLLGSDPRKGNQTSSMVPLDLSQNLPKVYVEMSSFSVNHT